DNCVAENNKIVCSIKESEPKALGPIQVPNFSKVTIRVTEKSPFDDCALAEVKLTEIKVADPITTILGLLTKAATGAPLPASVTTTAEAIPLQTPEAKLLEDLLDLRKLLQEKLDASGTAISNQRELARQVDEFFSSPPRSKDQYESSSFPSL